MGRSPAVEHPVLCICSILSAPGIDEFYSEGSLFIEAIRISTCGNVWRGINKGLCFCVNATLFSVERHA